MRLLYQTAGILVLAALLAACEGSINLTLSPQATPQPTAVVRSCDRPVVAYLKTGGIAGLREQWTVWGDGRVEDISGRTGQAAQEDVDALFAHLESAGFLRWRDSYLEVTTQCADCFNYTLTACVSGQPKVVRTVDFARDEPKELHQLMSEVQAIATKALGS